MEENDGEYIKGHTGNYIVVKTMGDEEDLENFVDVIVEKNGGDCLIGKKMK